MFKIMDIDGNGQISKEELARVATALFNNKATQSIFQLRISRSKSIDNFVDEFFQKADKNRNNLISLVFISAP